MSPSDFDLMLEAANRGYEAAFPGWKLHGLGNSEDRGVTLRTQDGRSINIDFVYGRHFARPLFRCMLINGCDSVVTRWTHTPDLAVDAALAGAKAMAAVLGGEG